MRDLVAEAFEAVVAEYAEMYNKEFNTHLNSEDVIVYRGENCPIEGTNSIVDGIGAMDNYLVVDAGKVGEENSDAMLRVVTDAFAMFKCDDITALIYCRVKHTLSNAEVIGSAYRLKSNSGRVVIECETLMFGRDDFAGWNNVVYKRGENNEELVCIEHTM